VNLFSLFRLQGNHRARSKIKPKIEAISGGRVVGGDHVDEGMRVRYSAVAS
jgi:hypothetical protein